MYLIFGTFLWHDIVYRSAIPLYDGGTVYHGGVQPDFDRAAEDALTDQLQEEYWDGSLKIDEEKVQNRFLSRLPMCWI